MGSSIWDCNMAPTAKANSRSGCSKRIASWWRCLTITASPTADRVNLRDLADDLFVIPNRATGGPMTDAILEECSHAGFRPRTAHEITTTTIQTTLGLISASIGVSLIPSALWPFSRKGVVFRPISENPCGAAPESFVAPAEHRRGTAKLSRRRR